MCHKCNEALLAAAHSALMLSEAAKNLYDINLRAESDTLAKAAAELFTKVKDDAPSGKYATTPGDTGTAAENKPAKKETTGSKLPQGFAIDDNGVVHINGVAIGRVVVIGPTKH